MSRGRPLSSISIAALGVLLAGLVLTGMLFADVRRLEYDRADLDFQQRADLRLEVIRDGIGDAVEVLAIINQVFSTFGSVSREQFHNFTAPLLRRYPYIQAFNMHQLIPAAKLPAFEAAMRRIYPGFVVTEWDGGKLVPAGRRAHYRVVDYIEPLQGNEAALGFDADSYSFQAAAMRRAVDTGLASATGVLRLVQETGSQQGFIILMAIYRPGAPVRDIADRRRAVIGDTAAVFRIGDLFDRILASDRLGQAADMDMSVYAGDAREEKNLIFRRGQAPAGPRQSWLPNWIWYDQHAELAQTIDVAGMPWRVVMSSGPGMLSRNNSGSLLTLIAGLLASFAAAAYIQRNVTRARSVQQLVERRTAELQYAKELLNEDIAARERAEQALHVRERAIEASANAILIASAGEPGCLLQYVNPAFEHMTGYSAAEAVGRDFGILWGTDTDQPGIAEIRAAVRERREGHATLRSYRKDGAMIWNDAYIAPVMDEDGRVNHFVVALYDITATKRYEAELEFQSSRDVLTGLANRNLLRDRLAQAIVYAERYDSTLWVVMIDLNRFKIINDTLGHRAGDMLLNKVAERMLLTVEETDTVARLGGDEFALALVERSGENLTPHSVQRVLDNVARPMAIEGHEIFVTSSAGIAIYPVDGKDADTLIKHAEIAMYRAKAGQTNFQFYKPAMNAEAMDRLRIESNLRMALERGEFILHYQPQVDLRSGRIIGMEALIRWQHPEFGMVLPARFIGLAEETGLITSIGDWVMRTACLQNQAWQDAGRGRLRVAVNLSTRQFYQHDLGQSVAAALRASGLAPQFLEIELTESLVMTDVERATMILRDLRALGVKIAIDDFGTGYSSLSYLKRFPLDILKIDQSFVRDIMTDPDDATIVLSIISLAHSLRLQVVAEGVETQEQLAFLRENRCDQIQGDFFSRPVSADAFERLLEQHAHRLEVTGSAM